MFHYNFQGGYAKCCELINIDNGLIFAGKVVSKQLPVKLHQKDNVMHQLLLTGVIYQHERKIMILKELKPSMLKLGNLFLNDNMELKIGDFGLAIKLDLSELKK